MNAADRDRLAAAIEHTEIHPDATLDAIRRTCREAVEHGIGAVCVASIRVEAAVRELEGHDVAVVSIAGFPLGAVDSGSKAYEAARAVALGADEIDMVVSLGLVKDGDETAVREDVLRVREACAGRPLKVILEVGLLAPAEIELAARAALDGGAAFLKTSTGVYSRGATVEDVRLLRELAGDRALVKASGGIRETAQALALLDAGATRLGTSSGVTILAGSQQESRNA
jgi:deoxyribose-phosphate aldolase